MSFTRFTHTAALIGTALIASSFAQGAFAQDRPTRDIPTRETPAKEKPTEEKPTRDTTPTRETSTREILPRSTLIRDRSAQGTLAQSTSQEPAGPIIGLPIVYPNCLPPSQVILATAQVFTCAWAIEIPDDFDPETGIIPFVATAEACAPNVYWGSNPQATGSSITPGIFWLEISCFHSDS